MTPNAYTEEQIVEKLDIGSFAAPGRHPGLALRQNSAGHSENFIWSHANLMKAVAPITLAEVEI